MVGHPTWSVVLVFVVIEVELEEGLSADSHKRVYQSTTVVTALSLADTVLRDMFISFSH